MFCKKCWINFGDSETYIQCSGPCKDIFHYKCSQLSYKISEDFESNEQLEWYCEKCKNLFRLQLFFEISICDDYSLPVDFVKKRPSSFDPGLADKIPDNWTVPSPLSDHVTFISPSTILTKPSETSQQNHPPLPNTIRQIQVNLIEGYSDPKDSKRPARIYHRKHRRDKRPAVIVNNNYYSDSSAPNSSADEEYRSKNVPELNSPDSISEDLIRPLPPFHKSPKKYTGLPDISKRNPSPYYYSDLLKSKTNEKEITTNKSRHSTASEPPQLTQSSINLENYRKSSSLDVPEVEYEGDFLELQSEQLITQPQSTPKRYSITEDGVRIIRCNTPSTTTSDDSDCSECQKRREWHANALALVRQTCNIQIVTTEPVIDIDQTKEQINLSGVESNLSMPPRRLLGPVVCACTTPALGDDVEEYFRPRSIFYVHALGEHECADCSPSTQNLNKSEIRNDQLQAADLASKKSQDMSSGRIRQIYETAFDCKIAKSDDDLDDVNLLTNSSVLLQIENGNVNVKVERPKPNKSRLDGKRLKNSKNQAIQEKKTINSGIGSCSSSIIGTTNSISALSNDLENIHIENSVDQMNNATSTSQLPMRGYTPSPPSTAPLPIKFPGKHDRFYINSIKSAPNLPSSNPSHPRLRDLRLPIQSAFRHHHHVSSNVPNCSNESSLLEPNPTQIPSRTRNRPRSVVLESGRVLELRKSHHHHVGHQNNQSGSNSARRHNYSSTESMATSSSGGSMESLRSSTSEGNRSTTSSESRHSPSLSSHSSESGTSVAFPLRAPILLHSKLHILSPISDKSSLEPASDASDFNKKPSPDGGLKQSNDISSNESAFKPVRRRPPPNKTLINLADEIIGSDSGISLHSREETKSSILHKFTLPKLNFSSETTDGATKSEVDNSSTANIPLPQDLHDLPFDMPKLRRKKVLLQQNACTSGSATSVDLGDLPFDMPKLRRRLRMNQHEINKLMANSTESSGISHASSSHSVRDDVKPTGSDNTVFRRNLTLNFNEAKKSTEKFGSLDLRGLTSSKQLNLNLNMPTSAVEIIDVTIPMERQGWYHGSITRLEAESTLRPLSEGCFLVRNCESTKQDYSLSLKGAKGFMHMRIQRNDSDQYILGQFSRPFDSVPEMIRHFCLNRLPVRGAEHMCLIEPVIAQLL